MLIANNKLKNLIRDFIPRQYQVPIKYYYNRVNSNLEPEMEILEYLVRKNDRVIDVGGNRGIYAYKFWKLGTNVEIFEPNINCSSILSAWAIGKKNVNVHPVALSNCTGSTYLHVPVDESGIEHDASGSVESDRFISARDHKVNLRELDSYHFKEVSLIKIDVEGHEYSMLEGAKTTLASLHPTLLVEIEQRHNSRPISEIFEKILGFEYRGFFMEENKLTELENFDVARHQSIENFDSSNGRIYINNFLFLHKGRVIAGEYGTLFDDWVLK